MKNLTRFREGLVDLVRRDRQVRKIRTARPSWPQKTLEREVMGSPSRGWMEARRQRVKEGTDRSSCSEGVSHNLFMLTMKKSESET